jgi:hypothetical protein
MANETSFTLTFKTIAQLTGLDQLMNGVQNGVRKIEGINAQLKSIATNANTILASAGSYLALSKLEQYAHIASEAREQQAAFTVQVLRSRNGSAELLEELNKLNVELAETTGTSESSSRAIERQLLLFGATKDQIVPLTKAIIEFAAARGKGPEEVTMLISRALAGEDLMLGRLGIHLDKTKTHAEQVQQLITQLARGGGNTAEVMEQASGGVRQAEISWGRLEKAVGNFVNLIRIPFLAGLTSGLRGLKSEIDSVAGSESNLGREIFVTAGMAGHWAGENTKLLGSIVTLGGGILLLKTALATVGPQATVATLGLAGVVTVTNALVEKVTGIPIKFTDSISAFANGLVTVFGAVRNNVGSAADLVVGYVKKIVNEALVKFYELAKLSAQIVNTLSLGTINIDASQFDAAIDRFKGGARAAGDEAAGAASKLLTAGAETIGKLEADLRAKLKAVQDRGLTGDDLKKQLEKTYTEYANAVKNLKAPSGTGFIEGTGDDGAKGKAAATDALTQSKYRLAAAEQTYKTALEQTKLLEESGQITHDQAQQRNLQAVRDYIAELEQLKRTLPGVIAQLEAVGNTKGAAEAKLEYQELTNKILEAQSVLGNSTVFGQMRAQIRQIANEWTNVGKQVGGFLTQQFQNFAATAGQMIGNLIFRTGNWKQSIVQLAQSFVTSLATMLIQWILARTVMSLLNKAFGKADAQATNAQATAAAASWAPAATSASIASYGVAAGTGLAAYLAALAGGSAAAIGASATAGGFQVGGFTGHGRPDRAAGLVHYEEVVFPKPAVDFYGKDFLVNMAVGSLPTPGYQRGGIGGGPPGGGGGSGAGGFGGGDITVINVNDWDTAVQIAMKRRGGRTIIVDTISDRSYEL